MRSVASALVGVLLLPLAVSLDVSGQNYLRWSAKEARNIGNKMVKKGSVSGDSWRVMDTYKSSVFKYRATWLTPAVIQATVRLQQLDRRLSDQESLRWVEEAENVGQTVFLIELDAIEGSGVIPADWQAFLQPAGLALGAEGSARGENSPEFRKVKGLAGTLPRDYKYECFWMVFPLVNENGTALLPEDSEEAELIIRILGKESTARFRIPSDIRDKAKRLLNENSAPQRP